MKFLYLHFPNKFNTFAGLKYIHVCVLCVHFTIRFYILYIANFTLCVVGTLKYYHTHNWTVAYRPMFRYNKYTTLYIYDRIYFNLYTYTFISICTQKRTFTLYMRQWYNNSLPATQTHVVRRTHKPPAIVWAARAINRKNIFAFLVRGAHGKNSKPLFSSTYTHTHEQTPPTASGTMNK